MKKTNRLIAITAMLLILASLLSLSVSAEETQESEEWVLSPDGWTMSRGDMVYDFYALPESTWFRPHTVYSYYQDIMLENHPYASQIGQPNAEGYMEEMVYLYSSSQEYDSVYVTAAGKEILDDFIAENFARYELCSSYYQSAELEEETVVASFFDAGALTIDVSALQGCPSFFVIGYDETLTFASVIGEVYNFKETYYYIHYDMLENNNFTADGYLSLRSGTVPAFPLAASTQAEIEAAEENLKYHYPTFTYETYMLAPTSGYGEMIIFLVMLSPCLFVLPCITMVTSGVLACIKPVPHRKSWLLVALLSLLWILLATLVSIALIVALFVIK